MKDERAMILKMLQEGKISVEEADALLDVLNEPEEDEGGGFAANEPDRSATTGTGAHPHGLGATGGAGKQSGSGPSGPRVFVHTSDSDDDTDSDHGDASGDKSDSGFKFDMDFDFAGLKDSLRSTMGAIRETVKGVSDTVKDAFESGDINVEVFSDLGRRMGKVRRSTEQSIVHDAAGASTLRIANAWGDVRINGTEGDQLEIDASITVWGATAEEADDLLESVTVNLERDEGWQVKAGEGARRNTRIDYEIRVPRGFSVTASTASGDVWIEEIDGSQSVNTGSGDVEVARLGTDPADPQKINTRSGDVVGAELTGQITVASLAGDVSINGFTGFLTVSASSGDIKVHGGKGSVQAKALSGDVLIELDEIGTEPITVTALSGDVNLTVPSSAGLEINARSAAGDINVDLELDNEERRRKKVTGTVNGGGLPLEVSTMAGDVHIQGT